VENDSSGKSGAEARHPEEASLLPFIKDLKTLLAGADLKDKLRVTPAGLFVEESFRQAIVEKYQEWLQRKTQGAVAKSEHKCMKRLFGSEEPHEHYLVEGKACFLGYLVACPIQQPQNMSLPYYLGSLTDTRNYLHPRDPRLAAMQSLDITPTADGMELQVRVRGRTYRMNTAFLLALRKLAERSPFLQRQFPELQEALREAARAAVKLLKRAAFVDKKQQLLVPQRLADDKHVMLQSGAIVLVAERGDRLFDCYELRGANLNRLIRDDLQSAAPGHKRGARVGPLEILPRDPRRAGSLRIKGQQYFLAPRAIQDFIERIPHSPALRAQFPGRYTTVKCVEALCAVCQQSDEISRGKISRHLENMNVKAKRFRTFERWLLAGGEGDVIVRCIEKGAAAHGRH